MEKPLKENYGQARLILTQNTTPMLSWQDTNSQRTRGPGKTPILMNSLLLVIFWSLGTFLLFLRQGFTMYPSIAFNYVAQAGL